MTDTAHEKQVKAAIARGLETLDAALGRPYEAGPLLTRVNAFFPALRSLPVEAVEWAVVTACARLEKYPVPAQLRRLAQASPAYVALTETKTAVRREHIPDFCFECAEPRAFHRITVLGRPMVVRVVRHLPGCSVGDHEDAPWMDPAPEAGALGVGAEAWRAVGIDWTPPREAKREEVAP